MQTADLDRLGVLRQTSVPEEFDWMTDSEKRFMLTLLTAGDEGVHKRVVLKEEKLSEYLSLRLSAHGLAYWERDKNGREMFFVLTWKGEEAAKTLMQIARNVSRKTARHSHVG